MINVQGTQTVLSSTDCAAAPSLQCHFILDGVDYFFIVTEKKIVLFPYLQKH